MEEEEIEEEEAGEDGDDGEDREDGDDGEDDAANTDELGGDDEETMGKDNRDSNHLSLVRFVGAQKCRGRLVHKINKVMHDEDI